MENFLRRRLSGKELDDTRCFFKAGRRFRRCARQLAQPKLKDLGKAILVFQKPAGQIVRQLNCDCGHIIMILTPELEGLRIIRPESSSSFHKEKELPKEN